MNTNKEILRLSKKFARETKAALPNCDEGDLRIFLAQALSKALLVSEVIDHLFDDDDGVDRPSLDEYCYDIL